MFEKKISELCFEFLVFDPYLICYDGRDKICGLYGGFMQLFLKPFLFDRYWLQKLFKDNTCAVYSNNRKHLVQIAWTLHSEVLSSQLSAKLVVF